MSIMTFLSSMNLSNKLLNLRVVLGTLKLAAGVRVRVVLDTPNLVAEVSIVWEFLNFATLKSTTTPLSHLARTSVRSNRHS